jgi:hypothetical protein
MDAAMDDGKTAMDIARELRYQSVVDVLQSFFSTSIGSTM